MATLKKQAFILTLANGYTRALGFVLRILTARWMGPQAIGVMELASSAVMLAVTPVTAGVPTAVSRLAARRGADGPLVLKSGLRFVSRIAMIVMPLFALLSPAIAWLLGDSRTLPTLLVSAPAIYLMGLCGVFSGYFCGRDQAQLPALAECAEQTVRLMLTFALLMLLPGLTAGWTAALPALSETAAGVAVAVIFALRMPVMPRAADPRIQREILALTAPTAGARMCQGALRALNAVLLPACLRRSGLTAGAATAQFGLLGGMVMPLLALPGVVTGAVSLVATPAVSRLEGDHRRLRALLRQVLGLGGAVGAVSSAALFLGADAISRALYHTPEAAPLLRFLAPCAAGMALCQVLFGVITGLGLQARALTGTVAASILTLVITAALSPLPGVRLYGAAIGALAGTALRIIWYAKLLQSALKRSAQV